MKQEAGESRDDDPALRSAFVVIKHLACVDASVPGAHYHYENWYILPKPLGKAGAH